MLIPDVNLLIYAYNSDAPHHERARLWWEEVMNGRERVGLPWVVTLGFIRLVTSRVLRVEPFEPGEAIGIVRSWIERPQTVVLHPGPDHLSIIESLVSEIGIAGRLTTDLHIGAIAIELNATLCSNDVDFGRFSGLRLRNPLQ